MEMELGIGTEEFLNDASHIAKGKRTKRHKPFSPCDVSSSSANDSASFSSTTTFQDEEQDMANCLILLAQGKTGGEETDDDEEDNKMMREKSRRISEVTTTATTKIGFYIYECKTCNRTFPSFQALGGHRASHKKPKVTSDDKKKPQQQPQPNTLALITNCDFEETKQARVMTTSPPISLQLGYGGASNNNNGKPKIHECSICGSEFTSGQALGGHMRRHRTAVITTTSPQPTCDVPAPLKVVKPPRNLLELDLNLPAPADDDHHRDSQFQFSATQKTMMLSAAPPLVDCHY